MSLPTRFSSILLIGLGFLLSACGGDEVTPPPAEGPVETAPQAGLPSRDPLREEAEIPPDPMRVLDNRAALSQFRALLIRANLAASIKDQPGQLIIAPTNEAFEALPEQVMTALQAPEHGDELRDLLKYHLVSGKVGAAQLGADITELQSRLGPVIPVQRVGDLITIGDAVVIGIEDGAQPSALILIVDRVLLPPVD